MATKCSEMEQRVLGHAVSSPRPGFTLTEPAVIDALVAALIRDLKSAMSRTRAE